MINAEQENKTTCLLELEWTALILEAKSLGMSIQEIRHFLDKKSTMKRFNLLHSTQ